MKSIETRILRSLSIFCIGALAMVFPDQMRADDSEHSNITAWRTATGQSVTPTAPRGAAQQFLNPHLAAYPNFIAGEAVRSQLSPDGKTLAVLCAGMNSLDTPAGATDTAASTQFIFLYDVSGNNKQSPTLTQVIQQVNSHVGLAFSPDGNTLCAAGGRDDAVYAYGKTGASWVQTAKISLGHTGGIGIGVSSNASGLGI